MEMKKK